MRECNNNNIYIGYIHSLLHGILTKVSSDTHSIDPFMCTVSLRGIT